MNVIKHIHIIIIICLMVSCADANKKLYGKWRICHYTAGPISALSQEEAQAFIGKEIVFTKKNIFINNLKLKNPHYELNEKKADDYFYTNYRIPKDYIGIKQDLITIVNINITQPKLIPSELLEHRENSLGLYIDEFILYKDELILEIDGIFFYLTVC